MYISKDINSDGVGLLGNKLFIIAACKAKNLETNAKGNFIPSWKYDKCFPNLNSNDLLKNCSALEYNEPKFSYTEISNHDCLVDLKGYFQSEKYFKEYRTEILEMFEPNSVIQYVCDDVFSKYKGKRITSIHVRRGDYVNKQDYHPVLDIEYYTDAMRLLKDQTDYFMVFSDDISWCKENIKGDNIIYSEDHSNIMDMFLMGRCDNHIIANSSFSFWGSWLNKNDNKIIVCPRKWFGLKGPQDWQDIYPKGSVIL